MHIFFLNTTKHELDEYSDLFEMERERRKIVSLACPFSSWQKDGYKKYVSKIGEYIDSYKDINGVYSLIVYVDLMDFSEYAQESRDKENDAYRIAMMQMITYYVEKTLWSELHRAGRTPQKTVIVFDQKQVPGVCLGGEEKNKTVGQKILSLWGFPTENNYEQIVSVAESTMVDNQEETIKKLYEAEFALRDPRKELLEGLTDICEDQVLAVFEVLSKTEKSSICDIAEQAADVFNTLSANSKLSSVALCSNRFAGEENNKENARRFLRLYAYLIDCAHNGTHTSIPQEGDRVKLIPVLDDDALMKLCDALYKKQCYYHALHLETKEAKKGASELGLLPPLYKLNCEKFGLNESGFPAKKTVITETIAESVEMDEDEESAVVRAGTGSRMRVSSEKKEIESVFGTKEFACFDYYGDNITHLIEEDDDEKPQKGEKDSKQKNRENKKRTRKKKKLSGAPEKVSKRYENDALRIKQNHDEYLEKLKKHLSGIHSHYAGKTLGDEPALLKKRVYETEAFFADEKAQRERRYALTEVEAKSYVKQPQKEPVKHSGDASGKYAPETEDEENVRELAKNAYNTVQQEYLRFCAGRSVTLSDIHEQCSWFQTRLEQIQESLKNIGAVGVGLFFAMLVVFLPFVLVQWTAITENALTLSVALGSIALPLVILYAVYTVISLRQKREFEKAWNEFKEKSRQSLEDNAAAVKQYDRLLFVLIPSLRWVYEYKLDVEQYMACCRIAKAKRKHHEDKLLERSEAVGNLLEDLEYDAQKVKRPSVDKGSIEYGKAFSVGEKNVKLYSILDQDILRIIMEGREE